MSQPICRHCAAGVQLFKQCRNLPAGTVLHGCSCLSGVKTYLLGLCCRGAALQVVSKPICRHFIAEVQLFKWCQNISAGYVLQWWSCLSGVETYPLALCCKGAAVLSGVKTLLQGCSCLSGVKTYLPALCCRVAAV